MATMLTYDDHNHHADHDDLDDHEDKFSDEQKKIGPSDVWRIC